MRLIAVLLAFALHCSGALAQNSGPLKGWGEFREYFERGLVDANKSPGESVETRFSYWGYRHAELHQNKLVEEMQERTKDRCCDGPHSGECRVSEVDLPTKMVMIDGQWCPMSATAKITSLDGLNYLKDDVNNTRTLAVVCAGRTFRLRDGKTPCPSTYCVGVRASY